MTQRQVIRTLYRGGQAAIFAELIVIAGLALIAILNRDVMMEHHFHYGQFNSYEVFLDGSLEHPQLYTVSIFLAFSIPTVVMFAVIWAWHLYFAYEGVLLMNWFATSIALAGATLMLLMVGLDILLTPRLALQIENGSITYANAYPVLAMITSTFDFAVMLLYGLYPLALALASFEKRLLPKWFLLPVVAVALLNDMFILSGGEMTFIANVLMIGVVLWPFIMGAALLRKAQTLAVAAYIQSHGSLPPQPAPWRLPHQTPTPTEAQTVDAPTIVVDIVTPQAEARR